MKFWKCLQGILPTNTVVKGKCGKGDHVCKCCGDSSETLEHMLFLCSNARAIWKVAPLKWDGLEIWKSRNHKQFNNRSNEPIVVINKALMEWNEYQLAQGEGSKHDKLAAGEQERGRRWDKPQADWIKINTDAALDQKLNKAGWGIVARNGSGELGGSWARPTEGCAEAQVEEALALREAMIGVDYSVQKAGLLYPGGDVLRPTTPEDTP
ncbi:uncharacterized protein [Coffea arabica]|uniref:Reverse transcriptase zinc-binding domain-containing protein n=1 Tax=Coffea arabica TaxID=13443 RepID=A0ABM4V3N0_COFAR